MNEENFIKALSAHLDELGVPDADEAAVSYVREFPEVVSDTSPEDAAEEIRCRNRANV